MMAFYFRHPLGCLVVMLAVLAVCSFACFVATAWTFGASRSALVVAPFLAIGCWAAIDAYRQEMDRRRFVRNVMNRLEDPLGLPAAKGNRDVRR